MGCRSTRPSRARRRSSSTGARSGTSKARRRGAVPFRTDFAQSCNTAFISLANRLSRSELTDTAKDFGVGEELKLGVPVADGKVPASDSETARAAVMIGQDKIVATPLVMAVVTGGTGTALTGLPGFVAGKSGTGEFGGGDPPPTHAWFIAFRDDIAVAVLVENGRAGGEVAAPIAAKFLAALG